MKTRIKAIVTALALTLSIAAQFAPIARAEEPAEPPTGTPVEVSDYTEFADAILNAATGDIITVTGVIEVPASTNIGNAETRVTLRRGSSSANFVLSYVDGMPDTLISGVTFDGDEIEAHAPFVDVNHNATFTGVDFINCRNEYNGGAVGVYNGTVNFINCTFDNNHAMFGGHLTMNNGVNVTVEDCTFTNGVSLYKGGAIQNGSGLSTLTVNSSVITGNHAGTVGGGIVTDGTTTITNTKIYDNTADESGADIATGTGANLTLNDSLETLISIFAGDGLVPVGFVYDYPSAPITTPITFDFFNAPEYIPLKLSFEGEESAPEIVYVEVPVEKIVEVPVEVPVYIYVPGSSSDTPPTPTPEETPAPVTEEPTPEPVIPRLVCGDAVIDASRRDYLLGYADAHAGQETPLKRSQAVQVIFRLLTDESLKRVYSESGGFLDISKDDWCTVFVSTLKNAGVVAGCGNDMFQPERNLTRGEMLTLFTRFTVPRTDQNIQLEHWSADAVRTAASLGWIEYDDDFNPNDEVTVQEFIGFALTVLEWAN